MSNNFKRVIDRMAWAQVAPSPNAQAAGQGLAVDLRNDISRNPFIYQLVSNTVLNRYNAVTKGWNFVQSPALAGTFGAGAGAVFAPSLGLNGNISTGSSTTSVTTSTAMTAVAPNMFANRGGSGEYGFKVRIISPSQGKIEERWIVGNTGGTTPTLLLDSALSFTPASGDTYEILGGRIFMLGSGTLASGSFKSLDVASNTLATKSQTNLAATITTDFAALALDEQYVPADMKSGEGFVVGVSTYDAGSTKRCLVATSTAASTITGQSAAGDAAVLANEYRNFQIRIVEDTTNKTAIGQRRVIASHTAGPSAVYTLGTAWTVQPSTNAKFVIEYPNVIILRNSATTSLYTYNYGIQTLNNGTNTISADAWSTTYFAAAGNAHGAGVTMFPSFGIQPDAAKNSRHSFVYCFRGGNTSLDLFDIAGGTTGAWTNGIVYDGSGMATPNTGTTGKYAPFDNDGKFGYMNIYVASAINQMYRFDVKNRVLTAFTPTDWIQTGTAAAGDRLGAICVIDGSDKYTLLVLVAHLTSITQECVVQG